VGPVLPVDRASLSESRQRADTGGVGADAASALSVAMVQPVGSGAGRGAIRLAGDAAIRGHRSRDSSGKPVLRDFSNRKVFVSDRRCS